MNVARHVKGSQKGFCKYAGDKRKTRTNSDLLLKKTGNLVTQHVERLRYGMPPSTQYLLVIPVFRNPRSKKHGGKPGARKMYPWGNRIRTGNT